MKKLFLFLSFVVLMTQLMWGQASGDYRSAATGNWSTLGTWERYSGTAWATPTSVQGTPTSSSGVITIRNGHTVTVTGSVSIDQTTVDAGGQITVNSSQTLTIANGTGTDLIVNGTVVNSGTITPTGAISFGPGSTYQHAQNGGTVPTATWDVNSTCLVTGVVATYPTISTGQTFGNFTWRCSGQTGYGPITTNPPPTFAGNLTVENTNTSSFRIQYGPVAISGNLIINGGTMWGAGQAAKVINVGGNLNISAGYLYVTGGDSSGTLNVTGDVNISGGAVKLDSTSKGVGTLNVKGNFSHTGGTITRSGSSATSRIVFNGTGIQTYTSGGTISGTVNDSIVTGVTLQMANASTIVSGGGRFTLSSGATLGITSADGITTSGATGNIQVTGTRTFSTGANYIYNGSGAQVTGSGLPATVNNLTINNTSGVTLSGSKTITNSLTVGSGSILDAAGFTLSAGSYVNNGTVRFSGASNGVAIGTGTVEYYGNSQTIATGTYNNLILSGSGTVNLSSVTINGTLSIIGNVTATLPSSLANLTINNSAGLTLNNPMTISGTLTFTLGNLLIGNNNLTLGGAVSGAADGQCIITNGTGVVSRVIEAAGSFTFPVGISTRYNPVAFTSPLGGTYTAAIIAGESPATTNDEASCKKTWTITGTNPANISFTWNTEDAGSSIDPISCTAWRYNTTLSKWEENPLSNTSGSGSVYTTTLNDVASFSNWTVGNGGALPVEMTSFTAVLKGTSALLKWSTATETNNSGFQIERSIEGSNTWVEVAFVNGAGTSSSPKTYSYEDKNLAPGTYVYRIKQIDNDGTTTIYNPNALPKVDAGVSNTLQLGGNYPNPFNPTTNIQFSVPQDGYASLKVYNVLGQEVTTLFAGIAKTGHYIQTTFDASRLASGIYFARLQYSGKSLVQRMLMTK